MLRSHTDLVLTIFPFEVPFFSKENLPHAKYVGNPSLEQVQAFELSEVPSSPIQKPYIAVLCGSRISEIKNNLPTMLEACRHFHDHEVVIAGAPGIESSLYEPFISSETNVTLLFGQTYNILRHARAALVTSGTATLETALLGAPQVVCYSVKGGHLANFVFGHFFSVPYISLVNLIASREVVSELYGGLFTTPRIVAELEKLLPDTLQREEMLSEYREVYSILSTPAPAASTAAQSIIQAFSKFR